MAALALLALLLPDCAACHHPPACHMTGTGRCSKRTGWRKHCPCARYDRNEED